MTLNSLPAAIASTSDLSRSTRRTAMTTTSLTNPNQAATAGYYTTSDTPVTILSESWWSQAACREVDNAADSFFSEELHEIAAAKRICADCPVIAPCLEGAIRRSEPWGVWGGQIFLNGRILAKKRRRGRPPKNPRPEDVIPDIPIPTHLSQLIA